MESGWWTSTSQPPSVTRRLEHPPAGIPASGKGPHAAEVRFVPVLCDCGHRFLELQVKDLRDRRERVLGPGMLSSYLRQHFSKTS